MTRITYPCGCKEKGTTVSALWFWSRAIKNATSLEEKLAVAMASCLIPTNFLSMALWHDDTLFGSLFFLTRVTTRSTRGTDLMDADKMYTKHSFSKMSLLAFENTLTCIGCYRAGGTERAGIYTAPHTFQARKHFWSVIEVKEKNCWYNKKLFDLLTAALT